MAPPCRSSHVSLITPREVSMASAQLEIQTTEQQLMVVPWLDPVVDSIGYEVRSQYVELFWLNVLGPTATWILRRLVLGFDRYPLGYELDLDETASALGDRKSTRLNSSHT